MSDIRINRPHQLGLDRARQAVTVLADDLSSHYGVHYHWQNNHLLFKHQGVEGRMQVDDRQVDLQVKLGFLMKPWRGKLETEIRHRLERMLSEA